MADDGLDTVEYQRNADDLVAVVRHISLGKRSRSAAVLYVGFAAFMLITAWGPAVYLHLTGVGFQFDWWFSIGVTAAVVIGGALLEWLRRQPRFIIKRLIRAGSERRLLGPVRLRIEPVGIDYEDSGSSGLLKWVAVSRIDVTSDYGFFMLGADNAVPVPRRAFARDEAFAAFMDLARKHRQAAPAFETECPKCRYPLHDGAIGCPECGWRRQVENA